MVSSMIMCVFAVSGCHAVFAYVSIGLMHCLYIVVCCNVFLGVSICSVTG